MIFTPLSVAGAFRIDPEKRSDERGFFARAWCDAEAKAVGLRFRPVQTNIGASARRGTLRGMHYQLAPHAEAKLVRCTRGGAFDVVVDLRPDSPSYRAWAGVEISAENHRAVYVPEGCAHGYLTLEDDTELHYAVSAFYNAEAERGFRHDDPAFRIQWPVPVEVISDKDRAWPNVSNLPQPVRAV